jgi:ankyrin repeat protein
MADDDPRHEQLCLAIMGGDDALALSIVRGGVDVNGGWNGVTHLYWLSLFNRVAVVSCLLELGADADKTTPGNLTPLGIAAHRGFQEVVELLVEVGNAQLNKQDGDGWTALHCAADTDADGDNLEIAKYLVARGCSLTLQDNVGRSALDVATIHNHPQLVHFLTSATNLITTNDFSSLRSLCAPYSSPFLSLNIARQLRYTTILAAHHARRIHDDPRLHTPIDPFLLRLALLPSADNRSPNTESQVFRRILAFVGT